MAKTLLILPADTIFSILCLLSTLDIIHFSCVNKECNKIVNQFPSLLFQIECRKTYIISDFLEPPVPYEQLLAFLKAREQNWLNLRPSAETVIDLPFLKIKPCTKEIFLAAGYIFVRVFKPIIHYLKLPNCSQCLDAQKTNWSRFYLGSDVIHYHLDVEQHDLIIIFTADKVTDCLSPRGKRDLKVHFRLFPTNEDHPKARWPKYSPNIRLDEAKFDVKPSVDIVGNIMAVTFMGDPNRLSLLDWQTGHRLRDIVVNDELYTSFMLISPEILLLPNVKQATLDIISIPILPSLNRRTLWKKLALPEIKKRAALLTATFRYSPFRADLHDIAGVQNSGKGSGHGLHSLNDYSIVIIDLEFECSGCYERSDGLNESVIMCIGHYYSLAIHRNSLLRIAESEVDIIDEEYAGIWTDYGRNLAIPWANWGPRITRWQKDSLEGFLGPGNSCNGHRRTMFPSANPTLKNNNITIRNYNPYSVKDFLAKMIKEKPPVVKKRKPRKGKRKVEEKRNEPKAVTTTTIVREREIIVGDVLSSLPYIMTEMDARKYTDVLMDDERLVAIASHGKNPNMKILFMSPGDVKFCGCNGDDGK